MKRLLLIGLALAAPAAAQVPAWQRPPGVTDSAIAWGNALFHGPANCSGCHGDGGRGTDRGPNITGALWLHGPGTYESLTEWVKHGVPAARTYTGEAMPAMGGSAMNEDDARAVAAYVWSISHPPQPPPPSRRRTPG
ncbi:MAG TPA: c-type cytochrome [Gemmatimonadales bacterium]|nr:c-type cytochrome [Gemmatimonadales bacterium]